MKRYAVISGGVAVLVLVMLLVVSPRVTRAPESVACTTEAKQCPDGSYVGRSGPSCEFAACPVATSSVVVSAHIKEEVGGIGVRITPMSVQEDSRCPTDVTCIQAGTVRLQAQLVSGLGTAIQIFTLNQPITTEAETITLVTVTPNKKAGVAIPESGYIFTFRIEKRTGASE